jgi:hypothetical protein
VVSRCVTTDAGCSHASTSRRRPGPTAPSCVAPTRHLGPAVRAPDRARQQPSVTESAAPHIASSGGKGQPLASLRYGFDIVPTARQTALASYLQVFEQDFRLGNEVLEYFSSVGDVIWAKEVPPFVQGPMGSWYVVVRLKPQWENLFGLTREFVVYCTTVRDLQVRFVTQAASLIQHIRRREERHVEAGYAVVLTADPHAERKVRDWGPTADMTLVPLTPHIMSRARTQETDQPLALLARWLHTRNLYEERQPVTGDRFFGREQILAQLTGACLAGDHSGVFGLRRIGKTSVLRQLRARLAAQDGVLPVDLDLQLSSAARSAGHIAHRLGTRLADVAGRDESVSITDSEIRTELDLPRRWSGTDPLQLITNVCDGMHSLLDGPLSSHRLVLLLDESEILLSRTGWLSEALDLLRGLRALAQETQRVSLVLSGVNASPCEAHVISGEDNPLFGSVSPVYLGPLASSAAKELVHVVGTKM